MGERSRPGCGVSRLEWNPVSSGPDQTEDCESIQFRTETVESREDFPSLMQAWKVLRSCVWSEIFGPLWGLRTYDKTYVIFVEKKKKESYHFLELK